MNGLHVANKLLQDNQVSNQLFFRHNTYSGVNEIIFVRFDSTHAYIHEACLPVEIPLRGDKRAV